MRRIIDHFLLEWKKDPLRKPLLLRGARQVGKTYAVRQLGKSYASFVEINLETNRDAHSIFQGNLEPRAMLNALSLIVRQPIIPGQTLLFLDEVQSIPRAITALRYFYELMPDLHVVAAGSLLDFALEEVGIPVGRVRSLYVYPLSFAEFLVAQGNALLLQEILEHSIAAPLSSAVHELLLRDFAHYCVLGGMPQVVAHWVAQEDALGCAQLHTDLLDTYRQDFHKYAGKQQVKYVSLVFNSIPQQLGKKFKYSIIEGDYRKRELAPAFDLLVTAGIVHPVYYSSAHGIPLGAQIDVQDYKAIFLDTGLAQAALGLDVAQWFLNPMQELVNKGALVESLVGQEMLAYAQPYRQVQLTYWHKETRADQAEIDYLWQHAGTIVPIEVKSGTGRTLKSMHAFLQAHPASHYGIRFSVQNYSVFERVHSYPLYAIAQVISESDPNMRAAFEFLVAKE